MNQPPAPTDHSSANTSDNMLSAGVDTATAALHGTIDKVTDPTVSSVNRLASMAHQTVDKLASSASQVAEKFVVDARRVQQAPAQAVDYSRSWVEDRPLEAVGAALAIGFLLGRLTR